MSFQVHNLQTEQYFSVFSKYFLRVLKEAVPLDIESFILYSC